MDERQAQPISLWKFVRRMWNVNHIIELRSALGLGPDGWLLEVVQDLNALCCTLDVLACNYHTPELLLYIVSCAYVSEGIHL